VTKKIIFMPSSFQEIETPPLFWVTLVRGKGVARRVRKESWVVRISVVFMSKP
jgi:hypothetical protein